MDNIDYKQGGVFLSVHAQVKRTYLLALQVFTISLENIVDWKTT